MKQILHRRQIRPHWMFVLDSLLSRAVLAALAVLAPGGWGTGACLPACLRGEDVILGGVANTNRAGRGVVSEALA